MIQIVEDLITKHSIVFSLLVLTQSMIGMTSLKVPRRLTQFSKDPTYKFMSIFIIALTASRNVKVALMASLIFLIVLYAIRDPDERISFPY